MQCHNCRSQLPEGVAFCQQCGTPISPSSPPSIAPTVAAFPPSYNNPGPDAPYNPSSMAPTVMSSQPSSSGLDPNYNPMAPTVAASQPPYSNPGPYTSYNPSSVPGSGQPYEAAQNPYSDVPYGQPQVGNVPPYASPQVGNVSPYAPPPPNNVPPYAPLQSNNASYGTDLPAFASPPPAKPKPKVGLIVGIVISVLFIACVGSTLAVIGLARSGGTGSQVNTVDSTPVEIPTPTPTPTVLSGSTIDPTAASILTNFQMASDVDKDTAKPKTLATSFKMGATVYVTFEFDFGSTDVTQQHPGYTEAKYYIQNRLYHTNKPLTIDDSVAPEGQGYAYFGYSYDSPTTAGAVEVYWCRTANCSDAKLAGTATFTVV